ncbi:hypothetical protein [Rhodoblastus sp.]|uniref:hypothetical protein n=1 Tax=Rhodoblastus sp. TaxID=1962975 RepID=UPI00262C4C6E|nr:hypothetical protein [Rhodoblastus sp.]
MKIGFVGRRALVAALVALPPAQSEALGVITPQPAVFGAPIIQVRHGGGVHRGGGGMHRAGNFNRNVNVNRNVNHNINVNRGLYRGPNVYYRGGAWVRPGRYWWPAGGAIAAGAALGFIAAASAASWAGSPPGPDYCWYYTDSTWREGFWDVCP